MLFNIPENVFQIRPCNIPFREFDMFAARLPKLYRLTESQKRMTVEELIDAGVLSTEDITKLANNILSDESGLPANQPLAIDLSSLSGVAENELIINDIH